LAAGRSKMVRDGPEAGTTGGRPIGPTEANQRGLADFLRVGASVSDDF